MKKISAKCHCEPEGRSNLQWDLGGLLRGVYTERSECARNDNLPKILVLLILFFSFPFSLQAGGPWYVDTISNSGTPARWPCMAPSGSSCPAGGKWRMRWKWDQGDLVNSTAHRITASTAVESFIKPMLEDWMHVKLPFEVDEDPVESVALEIVDEGPYTALPDITAANYWQFADADPARNLPTVVIFDHDGSIVADYTFRGCRSRGGGEEFCNKEANGYPEATSCDGENGHMGARNCIAGLAQPTADSTEKKLKRGFIILNGRLIDGIYNSPDNNEADPYLATAIDKFKAVIKHEFGHLLNCDHSQISAEIAEVCGGDDCQGSTAIGTMFPTLKTIEQYTLHVDDKVSISWLYPSQAFQDNFCVITGEVQNQDGKGLQGVNVIARSMEDPLIDARSMVSGVRFAPGTESGEYILSGIIPQVEYEVVYEELLEHYNEQEGSGFGPLESESPTGFGKGVIAGPGGAASVHCNAGGEVVTMELLKISLAEGRAISGSVSGEGPAEGAPKKGWCQLTEIRNTKYEIRKKFEIRNVGIFYAIISLVLILFCFRIHLKGACKKTSI